MACEIWLPGDGDVSNPEAVLLDKDKIGRAGAHVDDHDALVGLGLAVAEGVEERERGDVDFLDLDPAPFHSGDLGFDDVFLDRDDDRLGLGAGGGAGRHHLVIPGDLFHREGHVLLGLEFDHLLDLRGVDGRELDEAHEDALSGDGEEDFLFLDPVFLEELREGGGDEPGPFLFLVGIEADLGHTELEQRKSAPAGDAELGQLDGAGAQIDGYDFIGGGHG